MTNCIHCGREVPTGYAVCGVCAHSALVVKPTMSGYSQAQEELIWKRILERVAELDKDLNEKGRR